MAHVLLLTVLAGAVVAAAHARAHSATDTAAHDSQHRGERVAEAGTAAETQVEAIVPPVKRVAPRTPSFTHGAAGGTSASGGKKKSEPVVPARPNCDPGFKVDDKGTGCIKTAGGEPSKSGKKKKNR